MLSYYNTLEEICYLYWVHLPEHKDMFNQGYIGISKNIKARYSSHKGNKSHKYLTEAFKNYKDKITVTTILKGTREYCLEIENKLRPEKNIGWNDQIGGGDPPSHKGKAKSESWKKLMSDTKKGIPHPWTIESNKNRIPSAKGKKWYHDPVTKYSSYFNPGEQPENWVLGRFSRKRVIL
jgi:predicted GIY-YIG superfamily endonuclease